jgi:hypothetical protein
MIPPRQNSSPKHKKASSFTGKNSRSALIHCILDSQGGTYALMMPTYTMRWFFGLVPSPTNHCHRQHRQHRPIMERLKEYVKESTKETFFGQDQEAEEAEEEEEEESA